MEKELKELKGWGSKNEEWKKAGHDSYEEAIIWWYAIEHLTDKYNDMSRKELARTIVAGTTPLTLKEVMEDLEDEEVEDIIQDLEEFYKK